MLDSLALYFGSLLRSLTPTGLDWGLHVDPGDDWVTLPVQIEEVCTDAVGDVVEEGKHLESCNRPCFIEYNAHTST